MDDTGGAGFGTSLALDAAGNPHISYLAEGSYDLKYAHWTGTAWDIQTVDSAGLVGMYSSLKLDSAGRPHISYCTYLPNSADCDDLKYARWTGSAWAVETVDSGGSGAAADHVGKDTSLALDAADNPHISYVDQTHYNLKYARWTGTSWAIENVNDLYAWAEYDSLALDAAGNAYISYYGADGGHSSLMVAHWTGSAWAIGAAVSPTSPWYTSLALDTAGRPRVSYLDMLNGDLVYAALVDAPSTGTMYLPLVSRR